MRKTISSLLIGSIILSQVTGCTTTKGLYTGGSHQEFDTVNTILLPVAIAGAVLLVLAVAESNKSSSSSRSYSSSSSSSSSSCNGNYCDQYAAWDYLPGSNQYRCRNTSNGQFSNNSNCYGQAKQDNWR